MAECNKGGLIAYVVITVLLVVWIITFSILAILQKKELFFKLSIVGPVGNLVRKYSMPGSKNFIAQMGNKMLASQGMQPVVQQPIQQPIIQPTVQPVIQQPTIQPTIQPTVQPQMYQQPAAVF